MEATAAWLRRIEDRMEIDDLVTRYAIACDDRDLSRLGECFTADGTFVSVGGRVAGREAVIAYYRERFGCYGPSYHVPHRTLLDELGENEARGTVLAHSELMLDGGLFVAAHRYQDRYRREEGRWRIVERRCEFLYGMPLRELLDANAGQPRLHWPGMPPQQADIPENLPTWQAFERAKERE